MGREREHRDMVTLRDREGLAMWFSNGDRLKIRKENNSSEFLATKNEGILD